MEIAFRSHLDSNTVFATAVLSWHVQKFVAIWWPVTELLQGAVSIEIELRAKNRCWNGPLGHYSLSKKTSYHRISWCLDATRLVVIIIISLWNLTGISAALLPMGQMLNYKANGKALTRISLLRGFTRSFGKKPYHLDNRGPGDRFTRRLAHFSNLITSLKLANLFGELKCFTNRANLFIVTRLLICWSIWELTFGKRAHFWKKVSGEGYSPKG